MTLKAYLIDYAGIPMVVFASTPNKARYKVKLAAREVGMRGEWIEIRTRRLPGYDRIATKLIEEPGPMTMRMAKVLYLMMFGGTPTRTP